MKQVHLNLCDSTQNYLKIHFATLKDEDLDLLISCEKQSNGYGRNGNQWFHYEEALAFSFSLKPNSIYSLTSLEIGVLICEFFESKYKKNIFLKWPNDLMLDPFKKCGGIIIHSQGESDALIVGVGLNLSQGNVFPISDQYEHSFLFSNNIFTEDFKKRMPELIYNYILENRLSAKEVLTQFNQKCIHLNLPVEYEKNGEKFIGEFIGLGENGEAKIQNSKNQMEKIISGNLTIVPIPQEPLE